MEQAWETVGSTGMGLLQRLLTSSAAGLCPVASTLPVHSRRALYKPEGPGILQSQSDLGSPNHQTRPMSGR
jgi:hypothetical protein